jgi:hypothetical protein
MHWALQPLLRRHSTRPWQASRPDRIASCHKAHLGLTDGIRTARIDPGRPCASGPSDGGHRARTKTLNLLLRRLLASALYKSRAPRFRYRRRAGSSLLLSFWIGVVRLRFQIVDWPFGSSPRRCRCRLLFRLIDVVFFSFDLFFLCCCSEGFRRLLAGCR